MRTVYKLGLLTKRREQIRRLLLPYAGEPVRTLTQVALEPVLQVVTEKDSDINRVWFDDDPMSGIPEADEVRTQALRMRASVESCFQFLRGSTFTEDDVLDMSYLLAGWWDKIRTGIRYAPWDPKQPTWALVRIVDLYPVDRLKAYRVSFRCEAGKPVMARMARKGFRVPGVRQSQYPGGRLRVLFRGCCRYGRARTDIRPSAGNGQFAAFA